MDHDRIWSEFIVFRGLSMLSLDMYISFVNKNIFQFWA